MISDRRRKKTARPGGNGGGSFVTVNLKGKVPATDDILVEVDQAVVMAKELEDNLLAKEQKEREAQRQNGSTRLCGC